MMINPLVYFLLFFKATLFSSGGLSNLPSLHQDLLANSWATEDAFGQSVAIGQISPGPNGLWVISLGYLTYGYLGAFLALIAIIIPPMLILIVANIYSRIEHQRWVAGFMHGISLAVVSLTLAAAWSIINRPGIDWTSWVIGATACGLALSRRINIIVILGLAGGVGYLLYR